jgi:hypothetical protein
VRLRGCVAIELFVGALVAASLSGAAIWGVAELRGAVASETASAAEIEPAPRPPVAAIERSTSSSPPAPATAGELEASGVRPPEPAQPEAPVWTGQFLGKSDAELVAPLRDSPVTAVKLNRGGSSLSLRIDFESGGRAACKPNQIHMHSQPRREIAAYRINRLLGLSSVPPAVGRRFRVDELAARFKPEAKSDRARFLAEMVPDRDNAGTVLGELTWWITALDPAVIEGFPIDSTEGVVTWKRYLTVGNEIPEAVAPLVAQISNLLLFDFVINNSDRWSGGNLKSSLGGTALVFMDNTLAFGGDPNGHTRVRTYLYRSQKFSRRLVDRLRGLDEAELEEALTRDIDPFPVLLEENEVKAIMKRRDLAMNYLDELIQKHGIDAVLAFP